MKILRAIGIETITKSILLLLLIKKLNQFLSDITHSGDAVGVPLTAFGDVTREIDTVITARFIAKVLFAKMVRHGGSCR